MKVSLVWNGTPMKNYCSFRRLVEWGTSLAVVSLKAPHLLLRSPTCSLSHFVGLILQYEDGDLNKRLAKLSKRTKNFWASRNSCVSPATLNTTSLLISLISSHWEWLQFTVSHIAAILYNPHHPNHDSTPWCIAPWSWMGVMVLEAVTDVPFDFNGVHRSYNIFVGKNNTVFAVKSTKKLYAEPKWCHHWCGDITSPRALLTHSWDQISLMDHLPYRQGVNIVERHVNMLFLWRFYILYTHLCFAFMLFL